MGQKTSKDSSNSSMAMAPSFKKMIPQLLLSVSLLSFALSYSSIITSSPSSSYFSSTYHHRRSPGFYYYYYYYYYNVADKLQILLSSYAFNKNCLFLVCNGLLVLLAKTSGFNVDYHHAGFDLDDMLEKKICGDYASVDQLLSDQAKEYEKTLMEETSYSSSVEEPEDLKEEIITQNDQWSNDDDDEGPNEVSIFIADDHGEKEHCYKAAEENDGKRSSIWLFDGDEDELLYEEGDDEQREDKKDQLSTEELNQKFEEFIRKMKEEIIVSEEAQQNITTNDVQ